jgi:putative ABC transport system permease protein
LETRNIFLVTGDFTPDRASPAMAIDREQLLAQRLRGLPEFTGVALGGHPFNGGVWYPPIIVGHSRGRTLAGFASDTYLSTLGIPLLRGRNFTAREATEGGTVAVISESTARHFWPNGDAIGKHFELDMDPAFRHQLADFEVIGIAKDVRFDNPTRIDPSHVYLPAGVPGGERVAGAHGPGLLEVLVRIRGPYMRALAIVETTVGALDRDMLPSLRLINLEDGEIRPQRTMSELLAMVVAILAVLAVTLAGIGIYGVIAYLVYQRTREIGIRMALGANSRAILSSVVLQSLRPVFAGTILGLMVSAGLSSVLHLTLLFPGSMDLLYGVPFYDPITFGGLFCFVQGVAALASAVPAWHALRVDPMTALRYE